MNMKKRIIGLVAVFSLLLMVSGCTSLDGMRLSKALINQLNVQSSEATADLSLNVTMYGMEQDEETQRILDMINNSSLKLESKSEILKNKAYLKGTLNLNGIYMDALMYTNGQKTWVKIPTNSKYIEINPEEFVQDSQQSLSYKNALELQQKIRPLAFDFVKKYFSEYKYSFKNIKNKGTATINTPEGEKQVTLVEIKIDNNEFPKFVDYTIKNLSESEALKDYMKAIIRLGAEADPSMLGGKTVEDMEKEMDEEFNTFKEEVANGSEEALTQMKNYFEVGADGFTFTYGIDKDENIISSDIILDFYVKNPDNDKEKIGVVLKCKSLAFNINKAVVDIPQFTKTNSISLKEFAKSNETIRESAIGEALGVKPKRIYLSIGQTFAYRNGMYEDLDAEPYIEGESSMVPVRFIGESLGASIDWNDEEKAVIYKEEGKTIILHVGSKIANINGKEVEMPVAPVIKNGSTMVPLRFVSEQFGANVEWDSFTKSITIEK